MGVFLDELIKLTESIIAIRDSKLTDKTKFDLIFSSYFSEKIYYLFLEMNINLDWYNPDMDYIDDVNAYVRAVVSKVEEIKTIRSVLNDRT